MIFQKSVSVATLTLLAVALSPQSSFHAFGVLDFFTKTILREAIAAPTAYSYLGQPRWNALKLQSVPLGNGRKSPPVPFPEIRLSSNPFGS